MKNEKKRVAIICKGAGSIHRGSESFAIELGNYLHEYYDVDLYTESNTVNGFYGTIHTVTYKTSRIVRWYKKLYQNSTVLQKIVQCSRYTMILLPHYMENYEWGKAVFRQIKKNNSYNVIYPVNGPSCHFLASKYRKKYGVPFFAKGAGGIGPGEWWVLKTKPDKYVCISTEQYRWAQRYYSRLSMIPNGTYVSDYDTQIKGDKFKINEGHKLVICVGHLDVSFKRHQLAIEAVSKLSNVDLLILGSGEAKEEFEQLGRKLMPGRLKVIGVPHTEIVHYYKSADVFTLASLKEPFGIVYIEAMAAGLPCVTTDDETRREIIGNAGLTCDVENVSEYAETIRKALYMDWGDKPQKRAALYDYSIIGKKYMDFIEEMT